MNPIWTPQLLRSLTQLANIHVASVLHDFHVVPGTQDNKNLVSISFTFCKPEPLLSKPHKSPSTIRYNTKRRALRLQRQKGNNEGFHHSHPIPSHSDSEIISQDKISESVSSLSTDSPADITSSNVVSTTTINTPMTISHSSASSANFPEVKTLTSSNSMKTGPNSSKPSPIINNNSSQQPLLIPNISISSSTKITGVDSKSTSISSTTISQSNNSQSTISHHDNAQMDITMGGHKRARSPSPSPSPPLLVPATTNSAAAAAAAIKIPAALSPEGGSRQVSHLVTLPNSHIEHKTTADPSRLLLLQDKNNNNSSRTIPIPVIASTRPSIPIPTSNIFDVLSSSSTLSSSSSPQSQPPTSTTTASRLPPLPRRAPEQRSSSAQSILSAITATTTTTTTTTTTPASSTIMPPASASPLSYQKRRHLFSQFIFKLFIPLKLSDDTVKSMVQYHWESFIVYPHFNRPVNESDTIDKFSKHLQSSFNRPVRRMGHPPRIIRVLNELQISFMDLLQPSPTPTPTPTPTSTPTSTQ